MATEPDEPDAVDTTAGNAAVQQALEEQTTLISVQPSFSYMQAIAGFMGVVEAPNAADPEKEAEMALEFLETMWNVCQVSMNHNSTHKYSLTEVLDAQCISFRNKVMTWTHKGEDGVSLPMRRQRVAWQRR
jgi:hypothetical protein